MGKMASSSENTLLSFCWSVLWIIFEHRLSNLLTCNTKLPESVRVSLSASSCRQSDQKLYFVIFWWLFKSIQGWHCCIFGQRRQHVRALTTSHSTCDQIIRISSFRMSEPVCPFGFAWPRHLLKVRVTRSISSVLLTRLHTDYCCWKQLSRTQAAVP